MLTLALDTATDRCTVAVGDGTRVAHAFIDGSRRHAAAILDLIDEVLRELGAASEDLSRVVIGDGPGSFTGVRVAASVGKALAWHRSVEWHVAPSLLVRAAGHSPAGGGVVLALSDALRGELFAGCWKFDGGAVTRIGAAPRSVAPEMLLAGRPYDCVVGTVPVALVDRVRSATACEPLVGDAALPDARALLSLVTMPGGTTRVTDPASWQPDYGRPAEAQTVWERKHGMELPAAHSVSR